MCTWVACACMHILVSNYFWCLLDTSRNILPSFIKIQLNLPKIWGFVFFPKLHACFHVLCWDKKVHLLFSWQFNLVRYGNFVISTILPFLGQKWQKGVSQWGAFQMSYSPDFFLVTIWTITYGKIHSANSISIFFCILNTPNFHWGLGCTISLVIIIITYDRQSIYHYSDHQLWQAIIMLGAGNTSRRAGIWPR